MSTTARPTNRASKCAQNHGRAERHGGTLADSAATAGQDQQAGQGADHDGEKPGLDGQAQAEVRADGGGELAVAAAHAARVLIRLDAFGGLMLQGRGRLGVATERRDDRAEVVDRHPGPIQRVVAQVAARRRRRAQAFVGDGDEINIRSEANQRRSGPNSRETRPGTRAETVLRRMIHWPGRPRRDADGVVHKAHHGAQDVQTVRDDEMLQVNKEDTDQEGGEQAEEQGSVPKGGEAPGDECEQETGQQLDTRVAPGDGIRGSSGTGRAGRGRKARGPGPGPPGGARTGGSRTRSAPRHCRCEAAAR